LGVEVIAPLATSSRLLGILILGPKTNGLSFTPEETKLLVTAGNYAISAIEKARLAEDEQIKTEFVSIASHELLTPITAVEGYLSMILDENLGKVDNQTRGYLTKVYESAIRLSMLIKDILTISRIEAGRLKIEAQALDLPTLIQNAVNQLRFMSEQNDVKVILKMNGEDNKPHHKKLPLAWADPDRTIDILLNLISNAVKYSPHGTVTIRVAAVPNLPEIRVEIQDTGIGMSREQQAHLFEKFYRADTPETANVLGTGLGLYIVKSILEMMNGQVEVKSQLGKGSTFSFSLPIFKVQHAELN
jgi:signal transduction histidine kinase